MPNKKQKSEKADNASVGLSDWLCPKIDGKARIIYKNNKAYGIRDDGGYLFFFANITRFTGQDERYREEIEEQLKLADYLVAVLNRT